MSWLKSVGRGLQRAGNAIGVCDPPRILDPEILAALSRAVSAVVAAMNEPTPVPTQEPETTATEPAMLTFGERKIRLELENEQTDRTQ